MSKKKVLGTKTKNLSHYLANGDGAYTPSGKITVSPELPPGIYTLSIDMVNNVIFKNKTSMTDELIHLPSTIQTRIEAEINHFWSNDTKAVFDAYSFVYKRGFLLHGKPGTGKTCTIARIMEDVINRGGIVLFNPPPDLTQNAVDSIRQIQPDMKVVIVWEEFDNLVNKSEFLSLLDGESQLDNILYIATTNYIEKIPERVKNRPSRFASVYEVGLPDQAARTAYFSAKLKEAEKENLAAWVRASEGMVIDQMKDLILTVECFGRTLDEAAKKLKAMGCDAPNTDFASEGYFSSTLKPIFD